MKLYTRPRPVEAVQWNKDGDHPAVRFSHNIIDEQDGRIGRYAAYTSTTGKRKEPKPVFTIGGRRSNTEVHPGDWIITHEDGRIEVMTDSEVKEGLIGGNNLMVKDAAAAKWQDDDSPQAEKTFGVKDR
jgi:hypothetical protein